MSIFIFVLHTRTNTHTHIYIHTLYILYIYIYIIHTHIYIYTSYRYTPAPEISLEDHGAVGAFSQSTFATKTQELRKFTSQKPAAVPSYAAGLEMEIVDLSR